MSRTLSGEGPLADSLITGQCVCVCVCVWRMLLCLTLCCPMDCSQAPLSMGFSRQEHWRGLPCPPPRDLPDPGAETMSLVSLALAGGFFTPGAT